MREGRVGGVLCGPPCETWSRARHLPPIQRRGRPPRPLRSASSLWGLSYLNRREEEQVKMGNRLHRAQLLHMYACATYGIPGMLEHPIEPSGDYMASSWRLPETAHS
eukprot:1752360-Pyramimonas_sp.AAC.1